MVSVWGKDCALNESLYNQGRSKKGENGAAALGCKVQGKILKKKFDFIFPTNFKLFNQIEGNLKKNHCGFFKSSQFLLGVAIFITRPGRHKPSYATVYSGLIYAEDSGLLEGYALSTAK
jgi:hypothetical protein